MLRLLCDAQQSRVHRHTSLMVRKRRCNEPADIPRSLIQLRHQILVGTCLGIYRILYQHLYLVRSERLYDLQAIARLQSAFLSRTDLFCHGVVNGHHILIPPKALVAEQAVIQLLSCDALNVLTAGFENRCRCIGVFVYDGRQDIGQVDHAELIFQPAHSAIQQADLPI